MKKLSLIIIACIISLTSFAQNEKYLGSMGKALGEMATAKTSETIQLAANKFERIATAEKGEWLPLYYHAFCNMRMAGMAMGKQSDQLETYLDLAQASLDKAKKIAPNESEIHALQGYVYTGRIWPNPQVNGAKFSPMAQIAFGKAKQLNPSNPRAHFLQGQLTLFTPSFWGGGAANALPILETAEANFAQYEKPSEIHPDWGREENKAMLDKAKAELAKGAKKSESKGE